jgi:UDP-galactopyranose mutase
LRRDTTLDHLGASVDLLCLSHLRWDFVFQRPHHLLSRAARSHRVFYVEEPVRDAAVAHLTRSTHDGVTVVVPHIVDEGDAGDVPQMRRLLDRLMAEHDIRRPLVWYYTPMALPWSRQVHARARSIVYDCMDHLAGFTGAPAGLIALEEELLLAADLVFTGGRSLYEARQAAHTSIHCFPSSVDTRHFARARLDPPVPLDQATIARPRIGYFGVLDERIDWDLIASVAAARSDWQLVLVGPTAKVDTDALPTGENIHYLGPKAYGELPSYLAGWDVAMMPFARNDATRFISPTKTPEYLAGGRPVASTSIRDVVHPYRDLGLVHIGDGADAFVAAIEGALAQPLPELQARADALLARSSWDRTWAEMERLIEEAIASRAASVDRSIPTRRGAVPVTPAGRAPSSTDTVTGGVLFATGGVDG